MLVTKPAVEFTKNSSTEKCCDLQNFFPSVLQEFQTLSLSAPHGSLSLTIDVLLPRSKKSNPQSSGSNFRARLQPAAASRSRFHQSKTMQPSDSMMDDITLVHDGGAETEWIKPTPVFKSPLACVCVCICVSVDTFVAQHPCFDVRLTHSSCQATAKNSVSGRAHYISPGHIRSQ